MEQKTPQQELIEKVLKPVIYTKDERQLIKQLFGQDKQVLEKAIRRFFCQLGGGEDALKTLPQSGVVILKKSFCPDLDPEDPLTGLNDIWMNAQTKDKDPEQASIDFEMRQICVDYFKDRFTDLINGTDNAMRLSSLNYDKDKDKRENLINVTARNIIIKTVDVMLSQLVVIGINELDPKEAKKRLEMDSVE